MGYAAHIMILFLIINTTSCLVPGALLFGYGVSAEVLTARKFATPKCQILAGVVFLVLATVGYCGAIAQNKRKLNFYWIAMFLALMIEVVGVSLTCGAAPGLPENVLQSRIVEYMLIISHILVAALSMGLSITMTVQIAVEEAASKSQAQTANLTTIVS